MITEEAFAIYQSFKGDIDGFARNGSHPDKACLPKREWALIQTFLQDLYLAQQGLVSARYAAALRQRLADQCSSQVVISTLENLVAQTNKGTSV
jgi:hypothetical protein